MERRLVEMEGSARPLIVLLGQLQKDEMKLTSLVAKLEQQEHRLELELADVERESLHTDNTTRKWTDSSRVNGVPQRFLTKFLRLRLRDCVREAKVQYMSAYGSGLNVYLSLMRRLQFVTGVRLRIGR